MNEACTENPKDTLHCWHSYTDTRGSYESCCWCGGQKEEPPKIPPHGPYAMAVKFDA